MNALDPANGVPGVITSPAFSEVSTRLDGSFTIQAAPGRHRVVISAPGFVQRETAVLVPGQHAQISLIPSSFDLEAFNELARSFYGPPWAGRLTRWLSAPRLVLHTRVLDCTGLPNVTAQSQTLSDVDRTDAVSRLREALQAFSGNAFSDFASLTVHESQPGETTFLADEARWPGSIHAGECTAFNGVQDGGGGVMRTSALHVPSVGYALWKTGLSGLGRRRYVQQHELGHALALGHTSTGTPSLMSSRLGFVFLSSFDQDAGRVMFQRPPGNRNPDIDPEDYVVNGSQ